ncbi:TonB-dependent receptor domain-containing protein [Sphingomonas sp.]|uniref:TonB-dependent receptor n=1 Tax=Sphingomonas sp. TaxID=28214 RepID=UPI00286C641E|nr:TonB-dependent receptor [Sphingomonas sp.]
MVLASICIAALTAEQLSQGSHLLQQPAVADIIVTGERVLRPLSRTPSSVTVFTAGSIDLLAAPDRIEQLLALTPNVQLGSGGEGPTIRGQDSTGPLRDLPAFLGGTRPRVTIEVDGRAISYNELAFGNTPLWDVAQVEIFRSPQTTTQGRNAIAGAIFITTAAPIATWSGRARLIVGDARTRQASAVVSGPIVSGQLAFRVAGDVRRSRTSSEITDSADADPNRDDSSNFRAKLLLTPSASPGTRIELIAAHVVSHMPQIEGVSEPYRERRDPDATYGVFRVRVDSLTGLLTQKLGAVLEFTATATHGRASIRRFAPPGFGETLSHSADSAGETILDWKPRSGLRLTWGVRVDQASLRQAINLSATPLGSGSFLDRQQSLGLFGEASTSPLSRVTLIAGLRYQRDRQSRSGALNGALGRVGLDYDRRFDALLPKVAITYSLSSGVDVGLLVQRAYNPGGTTIDLGRGVAQAFGAETLWDRELFIRASFLDGRLRLTANLFDEAMRNAQRPLARFLVTPRGRVGYVDIVNEPRAHSRGAEATMAWRVSRRLDLSGAVGLLATRVTRATGPLDALAGKRFQRSPALTAAVSGDWRPIDRLRLSAQLRHHSGYFSDDSESASQQVGGATTVDSRVAIDFGRMTLFGYARNLLDVFSVSYRFAPVPGQPKLATLGDPREVGIGLDAAF